MEYRFLNMKEDFLCWLAHRLPRGLVYWCAVRVMAHAADVNPTRLPDELTPADCLKAWSQK